MLLLFDDFFPKNAEFLDEPSVVALQGFHVFFLLKNLSMKEVEKLLERGEKLAYFISPGKGEGKKLRRKLFFGILAALSSLAAPERKGIGLGKTGKFLLPLQKRLSQEAMEHREEQKEKEASKKEQGVEKGAAEKKHFFPRSFDAYIRFHAPLEGSLVKEAVVDGVGSFREGGTEKKKILNGEEIPCMGAPDTGENDSLGIVDRNSQNVGIVHIAVQYLLYL